MTAFAIIGCGKIAPRHAEQIGRVGKLTAVCDIDPLKAEAFGREFGATPYTSLADLLEKEKSLQVASICTPNYLHAPQSVQCLQAGLHVLCEKPLAISVADGEQMIKTATETGNKLFVVKSTRYNPVIQSLKQALTEGRLGKIYSFQLSCFWNRPPAYYTGGWRGTLEKDGGTLFTQFSHYIDVLYWLLGEVKDCRTIRRNFAHEGAIAFEDTGVVILEMVNDAVGTINYSVNAFSKNMEISLTLIGETGTVKVAGEYLNKLAYQDISGYRIEEPASGNPANEYGFYKGSMSNHQAVYNNLMIALHDPDHPFTSGETGLKTVEIIEKIYTSGSDHTIHEAFSG